MIRIDEETLRSNFSRNLKYLRLGKPGLSQEALARITGISSQSISRYETGICLPPCHVLLALSRYFGYTIDELLSEKLPNKEGSETNE